VKSRMGAILLILAVFSACLAASSSFSAARARRSGPSTSAPAAGISNSARNAQATQRSATVFSPTEMAIAFAKGQTLVNQSGMRYYVMTGRRDSPGEVELHTHYTDVIYITDGAATFVTGGRMMQGKTISPGEIRGKSIRGGMSHSLDKGSLVVVPAGVPHWFKSVTSPVTDLVIKVRTN
jgi:quercetin dioxygenase-like cupin family protein